MFVLIYIAAICAANLSAANFGIWITPFNAFFLIGLELVLRDILHHRLTKSQMIIVVLVAGVLSFLINADAKNIAIASFLAVVVSCLVDYVVYSRTSGSWAKRSNTSNIASGFTDSLIFPVVAFGVFVPQVFFMQWAAKVFGGALWIRIFLFLNKGKALI